MADQAKTHLSTDWGNRPLFQLDRGSIPDRKILSAIQVKQALDSYQVHLEERLKIVELCGGIISVRGVIAWIKSGAAEEDLTKYSDREPENSAPELMEGSISPGSAVGYDATPTTNDYRSHARIFADWLFSEYRLLWFTGLYCVLGFASRFFIESNPELELFDFMKSAFFGVAGGVIMVFVIIIFPGGLVGRRSSDLWSAFVVTVTLLVLLIASSASYVAAFNHMRENQLAPVGKLIDRCMEEGIVTSSYRTGAVCNDGTRSSSTGRGTCSHRGGVSYWVHPRRQTRTIIQCREQASEISWL